MAWRLLTERIPMILRVSESELFLQSTSQEAISPTASASRTALAAGIPQIAHTRAVKTTRIARATRYLNANETG
jgi:hypothetical protein